MRKRVGLMGLLALCLAFPAAADEMVGVQRADVDPVDVHHSPFEAIAVGTGAKPFTDVQVALMQTTPEAGRRVVYAIVPVAPAAQAEAALAGAVASGFDGAVLDLAAVNDLEQIRPLLAEAKALRDDFRILATGPDAVLDHPALRAAIDGVVRDERLDGPTTPEACAPGGIVVAAMRVGG